MQDFSHQQYDTWYSNAYELGVVEKHHPNHSGYEILYLEDHPMTCKWLITMVIVSPQDLGLWDPFQMAELHGLWMGVILTTYKSWDDPPSTIFAMKISTFTKSTGL